MSDDGSEPQRPRDAPPVAFEGMGRGARVAVVSPLLLYAGVGFGFLAFRSGWAAILGYHAAIALALTLGGGWSAARALTRGWNNRIGLPMVAVSLLAGAILVALWASARLEGLTMAVGLRQAALEGWRWQTFVIYYALVNPWLEELFWREWYPRKVRVGAISDLLFAGYHVMVLVVFVRPGFAALAFVVLVAAGAVWRVLARRFSGLLVPVASHLAADVSLVGAAIFLSLEP